MVIGVGGFRRERVGFAVGLRLIAGSGDHPVPLHPLHRLVGIATLLTITGARTSENVGFGDLERGRVDGLPCAALRNAQSIGDDGGSRDSPARLAAALVPDAADVGSTLRPFLPGVKERRNLVLGSWSSNLHFLRLRGIIRALTSSRLLRRNSNAQPFEAFQSDALM